MALDVVSSENSQETQACATHVNRHCTNMHTNAHSGPWETGALRRAAAKEPGRCWFFAVINYVSEWKSLVFLQ